jgi:hypothetical protein
MSEIEAEVEVEMIEAAVDADATEIGEAAADETDACGSCEDDEIDADADEE